MHISLIKLKKTNILDPSACGLNPKLVDIGHFGIEVERKQ
jgi:hypothetical protein